MFEDRGLPIGHDSEIALTRMFVLVLLNDGGRSDYQVVNRARREGRRDDARGVVDRLAVAGAQVHAAKADS